MSYPYLPRTAAALSALTLRLHHIRWVEKSPAYQVVECRSHNRLLLMTDSGYRVGVSGRTWSLEGGRGYVLPLGITFSLQVPAGVRRLSAFFNLDLGSGLDLFDRAASVVDLGHHGLRLPDDWLGLESVTMAAPFLAMKGRLFALLASCPALASLPVPDLCPAALRWTVMLTDFTSAPRIGYDLQSLATRLGLSPSSFCKRFKRDMGMSPQAWLNRAVGRKAAELLLCGDLTVGNVATTLGFDDESYFTRFFKKRFGLTPQAFVRNSRQA